MDIEKKVQRFKEIFLPESFVWRKGQKEAIIQIIQTYLEGKTKVVILDAPVGSGKSVIAMSVSWILNQNGKKGYILASDVALQEQYEKDFASFNLKWGSVKGLDHYTCIDNMEKHAMGTCRIRGKHPRKMNCYDECPYFSARDNASSSPTSLMNYAYWLTMQNQVNNVVEKPLFPSRDFTICDEGHKIVDIIQGQYTPRINKYTLENIKQLTEFFDLHKVDSNLNTDFSIIKKNIDDIKKEEDQSKILEHLKNIVFSLKPYLVAITTLKKKIKDEYPHASPPKIWRKSIRNGSWLADFYSKLYDFIEVIEATNTRNLVKNPQLNDEIIFNCLEENYLMHKYFHKHTGFAVIMSATFSDPKEYLKQIAIGNAKYIKLESTFDFSKSPIYYYNQRRMGYKTMQINSKWLYGTINNLIEQHEGENGIVHTASYKLTLDIYNGLSNRNRSRVLIYEGTREKREVLDELRRSKNKILMGPSLLEGLDLKHDWSRFQIFAKVPYLSLGDRFVKAKLALNPGWYQYKAALALEQGIGRSIRSEDDWAITYILDASFSDLIKKNLISPDFYKRIRVRK